MKLLVSRLHQKLRKRKKVGLAKFYCLIIRVLSDGTDNAAEKNFINFLEEYKKCSWDLNNPLLKRYLDTPWDRAS